MSDPQSKTTWFDWLIVGIVLAGLTVVVLSAKACGL